MRQTDVYTADICDKEPNARVIPLPFQDFGARRCFHGEIVTLSTYEDNSGLRELLAKGGSGKTLLIDGRQSLSRALIGGNIGALAVEHGWEGFVINGAVRDRHEMIDLPIGIKAIGTAPMKPRLDQIVQFNIVLNIAGVRVYPGQYLYADPDGVIVIDRACH